MGRVHPALVLSPHPDGPGEENWLILKQSHNTRPPALPEGMRPSPWRSVSHETRRRTRIEISPLSWSSYLAELSMITL